MDKMHLLKDSTWLLMHLDALGRFRRALKKFFPTAIFVTIVLIALYVTANEAIHLRAIMNPGLPFPNSSAAIVYAELVLLVKIFQDATAVIGIGILPIWASLAWLCFILTRILVDAAYQLFYSDDIEFTARRRRYLKLLFKKVQPRLLIPLIIGLAIALAVWIKLDVWSLRAEEVADIIGNTILCFIPLVWGGVWSQLLYIRRLKLSRWHDTTSYDRFLFSRSALTRSFKSMLDVLFYLAFLGWVLLPAYFMILNFAASKSAEFMNKNFEYAAKREFLVSQSHIPDSLLSLSGRDLERPERLTIALLPNNMFADLPSMWHALPRLQNKFFFLVTLGGLLEVAIPSIAFSIFVAGLRRTLRRALIVTLRSTVIIAGLQLFIKKAYFLDIGDPIGFGAVFMFIVSFVFTTSEPPDLDSAHP